MYDVHVIFSDMPGELARFGQLLGRNGVGLEGGGVFGTDASCRTNYPIEQQVSALFYSIIGLRFRRRRCSHCEFNTKACERPFG